MAKIIHFSVNLPFNVPAFKNSRQIRLNKRTGQHFIGTDTVKSEKMQVLIQSLHSSCLGSMTLDDAMSMELWQRFVTLLCEPASSRMMIQRTFQEFVRQALESQKGKPESI